MNLDALLPDSDLDPALREHTMRMRSFATEKLAPHARAIDEERRFRHESIGELAAAGILGGPLDPAHGGAGWSPMELVLAHEEIGAVCSNTRGFLAVHTGLVAQCIERYGDDAQRDRWLPKLVAGDAVGCFALTEPEAGSDVASLRTRAMPGGEGFSIHGHKIWITNGNVADVAIVFATVDPDHGREGITAFLVETNRPGLRRETVDGVELGHRGSDHAQLLFDGTEVPATSVMGGVGQGFDVAMGGLHAGRLSVAAGAVGMHRAALQACLEFVSAREQFGKPLAKFQMVQERIADMTVELLAARGLLHRCARRRAEGRDRIEDLAVAKLYTTEAAARAAEQAVQLHASRGYSSAYPVERLLRDIQGLRIYEGTSMIQKLIIARQLLKSQ